MKWFTRLLEFYLNSSIHVALSVVSFLVITQERFNIMYKYELLFFVFFSTITGYNFIKYAGVAKFHHRSLTKSLRIIQIFSFFCFVLMVYFFFQLSMPTIKLVAVFAAITFFYAIPFVPKLLSPIDENKNLRSISGIKIYVIALVWAGVTVILPFFEMGIALYHDVWIETAQRFLWVILLMIPFEIRDMKYDSIKLGTIPQKIGIKRTKRIALFLVIILFALEFFRDDFSTFQVGISLFVLLLLSVLLIRSTPKQNKYYSALWVEGIPIFWLVLILILK
ncbi:UbiA prenyltransferase family protein [Spongiivirga citrea]|uniref:Prenyltransferase n=1 Tax=Spongiivirga citrea TaxID=1481457 RepID=A0A6M0CEH2_9FLAO|nr:hypothetical protein [Spongiivirga citrea]NER16238.1 hypothetical protein [Spongiivirga citrea]